VLRANLRSKCNLIPSSNSSDIEELKMSIGGSGLSCVASTSHLLNRSRTEFARINHIEKQWRDDFIALHPFMLPSSDYDSSNDIESLNFTNFSSRPDIDMSLYGNFFFTVGFYQQYLKLKGSSACSNIPDQRNKSQ
jgi:hypothetical protein